MFESLEGIWIAAGKRLPLPPRFRVGQNSEHRRLHPGKVNMKRYLLAIAVLTLPWAVVAASPTAKVEQGVLKGTREGSLTVYRGIPFAAPPVGDLRWRPPQPAAKWRGVRTPISSPRSACRIRRQPQATRPPEMSEDCLYLNVWTPAKSAHDRIPVLVWIYGGGFNAGATSIPIYSGEVLAQKGVVLVSIAYRVGPLGFPGASGTERGVHASCLRQLRPARHDRRPAVDPEEHRGIRRRSQQGHDLRRVRGRHRGEQVVRFAAGQGAFPGRGFRERRLVRPSARAGEPGENMRLLADAERDGV